MIKKNTLMEFPCVFPIKIIGIYSDTFLNEIKLIVIKHFQAFTDDDLTIKTSGHNKYLAITVNVLATNQVMLDEFYQEVTKHPNISMVL